MKSLIFLDFTQVDFKQEIRDFILSYDLDLELNYKLPGLELDFYVPSCKIAIEFNDLLNHSSSNQKTDKIALSRHLNKTELCEKNGIKLLHIFENEWESKKSIWKSVIANHLGRSERIYARKCNIVELSHKLAKQFHEWNHLQGYANGSHHYGLEFNNELVSLITVAGSRYTRKESKTEIIRYANRLNTTVVGGFSKLLKKIEENHETPIVSYANRRWSTGNLYQQTGFKLLRVSGPCYYYINDHTLYHRSVFMKHKLKDQLKVFDESLTEVENMYNNGYRRIWDCGNLVYIKE